jgi:hypothetical protein
MQNQAIEDMIGRIVNSNQAKRDRECYYIRQGIYRGDPRMELDDLPLGRIAIDDWKYSRVLDRMLMYERRMENSMIKLMKELKRFQKIRRIELENTEQKRATPTQAIPKACGFDAATRTTRKKVELKKQSQFAILQVGAKSYLKRDYGNNTAGGDEENKANQTCPEHVEWRQFPASEPTKGTEKTEQLVTSLTVQPD